MTDSKERRRFIRVKKNLIMRLSRKDDPNHDYEVTQLINISKGGICFSLTHQIEPNVELLLELHTPFIAEQIFLDGKVLACVEKIANAIYHVHLEFENVSANSAKVLDKIEEYYS